MTNPEISQLMKEMREKAEEAMASSHSYEWPKGEMLAVPPLYSQRVYASLASPANILKLLDYFEREAAISPEPLDGLGEALQVGGVFALDVSAPSLERVELPLLEVPPLGMCWCGHEREAHTEWGCLCETAQDETCACKRFVLADTEAGSARKIAVRVLDRINGDPDDELAVLSRHLLRMDEHAANHERQLLAEMKVSAGLRERCDELFSEIERARRIIAEQIARAEKAEAELQSLRERQEKAVKLVESIADWKLPPSGCYWSVNNGGREMSYEAAFGSNGARDYMKQVAAKAIALLTQPEHSTQQEPSK